MIEDWTNFHAGFHYAMDKGGGSELNAPGLLQFYVMLCYIMFICAVLHCKFYQLCSLLRITLENEKY